MAISLKSNLVEYYQKVGTNTGTPPALDSKGDYGPIFNIVNDYSKNVIIGSAESSPLFNKYPIGFFPDNPFARQPEKFNPNLIMKLPKLEFYKNARGTKPFLLPKAWKDGRDRITFGDLNPQSINTYYTTEQSLSPLTALYNQSQYYGDNLNFRSDGVTTNRNSWGTATDQPYILRGIQRVDNKKKIPQSWGLNDGFDAGLMRGGMVTALNRSAVDALRIGKFLISPKGILFNIKQVGLQLTNPNVESPFGIASLPFLQTTKIWTPSNLLANITGNALGLHFKRHGLLPIGDVMSYEDNVVRFRPNIPDPGLGVSPQQSFNRLNMLRNEFFLGSLPDSKFGSIIKGVAGFVKGALGIEGTPIMTLSGLTGPKSVYGIGLTTIRRYTDTSVHNKFYPGTDKSISKGSSPGSSIDKYSTLAYGKLGRNSDTFLGPPLPNTSPTEFNDFRENAFALKIDKSRAKTPFIGNPEISDYIRNNPISKFGMGNQGLTSGVDRSDYQGKKDKKTDKYKKDSDGNLIGLGLGDRINSLLVDDPKIDSLGNKKDQIRDYVKFQFKDVDGTSNIMVFRATFGTLTDNFNPNWAAKQYMGRPDPVYIYESYSRDITFDFTVYADTRENMKPMWQKLNKLASYTTPEYDTRGRASSPIMKLTLGDYLVDQPGFLSTFNITTDGAHPWDINLESSEDMFQMPMIVKVNISYKIINQKLPQRTAWFFGNEVEDLNDGEKKGLSLGRKWLTPKDPAETQP